MLVHDLEVKLGDTIAIVRFKQTYRSGDYEDHGTKTLYLLPENGEWRIFNEEWTKAK